MKDIVILGVGNHDILRLIEEINDNKPTYNVVAILEKDVQKHGTCIYGIPILGGDELLLTECKSCGVVNNIMFTPQKHRDISKILREKYEITDFPNIVHPSVITKYVSLGEGNIIYEYVHLGTDASIGNFNIIYPFSGIGHETMLGDYNLVALNAKIGARSRVGECNLFSNQSMVSLGLQIGNNNNVGVGSVVVDNVYDNNSILGNPALPTAIVLRDYLKVKRKFE